MKAIMFVVFLISTSLWAESEVKHQISLGNDLMGWHGTGTQTSTDDELGIKAYDLSEGNFNINYMYQVVPKVQIGFIYSSFNETSELSYTSGGKLTETKDTSELYFQVTYNFNDDLSDSFYITPFIGQFKYDSTTKDTSDSTKLSTEYKVNGYGIKIGKRFPLTRFNIQNLTYAPQISIGSGKVTGDLKDAGVDSLTQAKLDIIKFDLLF